MAVIVYIVSVLVCTMHLTASSHLDNTFQGELLTSWPVDNGTKIEGVCYFKVDEAISPDTVHIGLDFGMQVTDFKNWVGNLEGDNGSTYVLTNKYWIHDILEVRFHATYTGDVAPTITCFGDLQPAYTTTTTTTTPVPTTLAAVNGGWSEYGAWTECSTTCNEGTHYRTRVCDSPEPANGGMDCEGDVTDTKTCNLGRCPIW